MSRRRPTPPLLFALALAGLACTPWPGDTVHHFRPPREPPAPRARPIRPPAELGAEELTSDLAALGDGLPDLSGTWAQQQVTVTLSNAPIVGEIRSTTTILLRVELVQQGAEYTARAEVCGLEVESSGSMRTQIPERFVAGIPAADWLGRVERFEGGYRIVQVPTVQVLGARLDDPLGDPLPEGAADERVLDPDGDGQPGMTIRVDGMVGGDIYLVQRTVRTLEGVVRDLDAINGHITWTMEQITLGASSFLLNVDTRVRADPTREHNVFRARRVAPETDCAALLRTSERLFTR